MCLLQFERQSGPEPTPARKIQRTREGLAGILLAEEY